MAAVHPLRHPPEGNTTTAGESSTSQRWCRAVLLSTPDGVRTCTASFCSVTVTLCRTSLSSGLAPRGRSAHMGHRGTAQKCTLVGLSRQYMVRRFEYAIILVKAFFVFASRADTDRQKSDFVSSSVWSLCDLSESARAPPAPHAPQPHPHAQSNPVIHLLVLPHPQTTMFKRTRLGRGLYPPSQVPLYRKVTRRITREATFHWSVDRCLPPLRPPHAPFGQGT